jgi:hypothetical protein
MQPCRIPNCPFVKNASGKLCGAHKQRQKRGAVMDAPPAYGKAKGLLCCAQSCSRPAKARSLCETHRKRKYDYGMVDWDRPLRDGPKRGFSRLSRDGYAGVRIKDLNFNFISQHAESRGMTLDAAVDLAIETYSRVLYRERAVASDRHMVDPWGQNQDYMEEA